MIGIGIFLIIVFFMASVGVAIYEEDIMYFFMTFVLLMFTTVAIVVFLGLFLYAGAV